MNGIGPVTGHKLIEMYGTAKIIYENRNKLKVKDPSQRDKDAIERCSATGKLRTISLAAEAVAEKKLVVSGLAKGIDSYAHTAAIKSGGKTIAILGNGVDICYPSEHEKLYQAICENGAIVSEYPPGTIPQRYNFPRRNRIIAGLSEKLYVIEAGDNSGTRSTVEATLKYRGEVQYI